MVGHFVFRLKVRLDRLQIVTLQKVANGLQKLLQITTYAELGEPALPQKRNELPSNLQIQIITERQDPCFRVQTPIPYHKP